MTESALRQREINVRNSIKCGPSRGMIVSHLTDIRWLSGFSGSNASIAMSSDETHLFTDGRYDEQASRESPHLNTTIASGDTGRNALKWLQDRAVTDVAIQADHLSASQLMAFKEEFSHLAFLALDPLPSLRAVKDESELVKIRSALKITEQVFEEMLPLIRPGVTENELAAEIDYKQRQLGAEGSSFDTIVAFGPNSALPHARPGPSILETNQPVLMDFGCVFEGYASDMTRTVHVGEPTSGFRNVYASVLSALEVVTDGARSGMSGLDVDALARQCLSEKDLDVHFKHSLGHGVGLDIHEWPTLSKRGVDILPDGCVVTFEPGVYLKNEFGIRIEDMAVLRPDSAHTLNSFTTDLIVL